MTQGWEYERLELSAIDLDDSVRQLNQAGKERWEVAALLPLTADPKTMVVLLKRQRGPSDEPCTATVVEHLGGPELHCDLRGHHAEHEGLRFDGPDRGTVYRWRTDSEGKPLRSSKRVGKG